MSQGPNAESLNDLATFIRQKTDQVRQMAEPATQEAWDKALSSASPYLDKLPDIRQLLEEKKSVLLTLGASALSSGKGSSGGELGEVMKKVKEVAEVKDEKQRKEKMKELKKFVLQKAEEAQKKVGRLGLGSGGGSGIAEKMSWGTVEGYVKTLPGGEQVCLMHFLQLAADRQVLIV